MAKLTVGRSTELLSREAFLYQEMEALQGSVIPLCYGLFQTTVIQNLGVRIQSGSNNLIDTGMNNIYHLESVAGWKSLEGSQSSETSSETEIDEEDQGKKQEVTFSILLLERLGEKVHRFINPDRKLLPIHERLVERIT